MSLTYLDPSGSPGKTSDATDVIDVGFAELVPPRLLVQRAEFTADDPAYAGIMTMTWRLDASGEGTEVSVTAVDVPRGIDQAAHEAGIASSLANLASFVENLDGELVAHPSVSVQEPVILGLSHDLHRLDSSRRTPSLGSWRASPCRMGKPAALAADPSRE